MSSSLRYRKPIICEHLASQYVAGVMSQRVRRRTEVLRLTTPELDRAIAHWSDQLSLMHDRLADTEFSEKTRDTLWQGIEGKIDAGTNVSSGPLTLWSRWWSSVDFWRWFSGVGAMASVILATVLVLGNIQHSTQNLGPSYLANMVAQDDSNQDIQFVISAYAKQENQPSRLHVQWLKGNTKKVLQPLHLWAEEKDTGKLAYIGLQPSEKEAWNLTKAHWAAVSKSQRLFMTKNAQRPADGNIAFSGVCLQLTGWKS